MTPQRTVHFAGGREVSSNLAKAAHSRLHSLFANIVNHLTGVGSDRSLIDPTYDAYGYVPFVPSLACLLLR
jgi:hypothetical protein